MSGHEKPKLLLVGFSWDIKRIAATVDQSGVEVFLVNEDAKEGSVPSSADLVIYAMSQDTGWSSRLYSIFTYVYDFVKKQEEYIVFLDGAERPDGIFPSLPPLPSLRVEVLTEKLQNAAFSARRS